MIARHPGLRFQVLLASRHANQTLCTFARELPNFSLAGYWWHNFLPQRRQPAHRRAARHGAGQQAGRLSSPTPTAWSGAYGKWLMVRKLLASALAARVDRGQYTVADALSIARTILFETPQTLLGMVPRAPSRSAYGAMTKSEIALSIDLGTPASRPPAFDEHLRCLGSAYVENRLHYPAPGLVEQDPAYMLASALDLTRQVVNNWRGRRPGGGHRLQRPDGRHHGPRRRVERRRPLRRHPRPAQ
jgi:hypothetical protein